MTGPRLGFCIQTYFVHVIECYYFIIIIIITIFNALGSKNPKD